MTAPKSTDKPDKPYPSYPLTPHSRGYWCKKFRGTLYNCGPWDDPKAALEKWHAIRDRLELGQEPVPPSSGELTVKQRYAVSSSMRNTRSTQPVTYPNVHGISTSITSNG